MLYYIHGTIETRKADTMKTINYRGTAITTDGYCFYVATKNDEYPFDTLAEARAFIDGIRLEHTLNAMARNWYK